MRDAHLQIEVFTRQIVKMKMTGQGRKRRLLREKSRPQDLKEEGIQMPRNH